MMNNFIDDKTLKLFQAVKKNAIEKQQAANDAISKIDDIEKKGKLKLIMDKIKKGQISMDQVPHIINNLQDILK